MFYTGHLDERSSRKAMLVVKLHLH